MEANLIEAKLGGANLSYANLSFANLIGANLSSANLGEAKLIAANLSEANLSLANLGGSYLARADLSRANLSGANLTGATLLHTNLERADLTGCSIYGISVWDARLDGAKQSNLLITPKEQPAIQVDNLEVAQFIYLLLNNARIRHVIDTIGKKAVLILGRFTPERRQFWIAFEKHYGIWDSYLSCSISRRPVRGTRMRRLSLSLACHVS